MCYKKVANFTFQVSFVVILVLAVVMAEENIGKSFAGKKMYMEVIPDRVEVVFETPEYSEAQVKVRKVKKERVVVGWIDIRTPIGNDFITQCKLLKKQGGEYKYLPYVLPSSPVCDFMKKDIYLYPDMAKHSDFPEDTSKCPMAVGNYSIYDFTINTDKIVSVATHSGEYAAEVIFSKDGNVTAIYRAYGFINNV